MKAATVEATAGDVTWDDGNNIAMFEIEKAGDSRWDQALTDAFSTQWLQDGKKVITYPIDLKVLLDASIMSTFHRRCLVFKRAALMGSGYESDDMEAVARMISKKDMRAFADDWLAFANAYLEIEKNAMGRYVRLHHVRATSLWRKPKGGWLQKVIIPGESKTEWRDIDENKIIHFYEYSPLSDWYGVPDYLPNLLPISLSYEADDFHRKFYQNGAHAGLVILLKGIKGLSLEQRKEIEEKFKGTKGPGNFKSIFMGFNSSDVELEIIGVAKEAPVKDDYPEITKSTREKIISAHGIPPRLMSIILDAKSGAMAGQVDEELRLFNLAWVEPAQLDLEDFLNEVLPAPIKFKPFLLSRSDNTESDGDVANNPAPNQLEEDD